MTVPIETCVLRAYQEGRADSPKSQSQFLGGQTLVRTAYGFGVIDSVNPVYGVVRILLLNPDMQTINPSASVSLPWDKVQVLPDEERHSLITGTADRSKRNIEGTNDSIKSKKR